MRTSLKPPKPDFIAYCNDLAKQEAAYVNSIYLSKHFGFSFADLFDQTVAKHEVILSALQSSPYCIIAHATPEYDPDYSHVGVYLKNRYDFSGEIMDVIAHDDSVRCIAFHLLSRFFHDGFINPGAVILFEQSVIPVSKYRNHALKNRSQVAVYLLSKMD